MARLDAKMVKMVSSAGESATIGSLPTVSVDGVPVIASMSQRGVQFVSFTNSDGDAEVSIVPDDSAMPATPVGILSGAIYRSTLPTYTNGDASILHTDSRGRLLVSYGEGPATADVEADDSAAPANPIGTFIVSKVGTPITYTSGDAATLRSDTKGRIVTAIGGTNASSSDLLISVETDNLAGPAAPNGTFPLGMYRASLPNYTSGDAATLHVDSRGRLLSTLSGTNTPGTLIEISVETDNLAAPAAPNGIFPLSVYRSTLPTYTDGDATIIHSDVRGRALISELPTVTPYFDSDGDNTAQALKASAGTLYNLNVYNSNNTVAFIQLFNAATGSVVVGTTTPVYVSLVPIQGSAVIDFCPGMIFTTAITYACTTTPTGAGDPTTGLVVSGGYI